MATKSKGSNTDSTKINEQRSRRVLDAILNVLFWVIFFGTFILDFRENQRKEIPQEILSGTWEEVTIEMTN